MDTNQGQQINTKVLHKDLSYKVQGAVYQVAGKYGKGLKEIIYQKALVEALTALGIKVEEQKSIMIHSVDTGKVLGTYRPDLIIEDLIVMEIKATDFTINKDIEQQMSYLKASKYELGYLVNFGTPKLYIKRTIYTNNRKPFLQNAS